MRIPHMIMRHHLLRLAAFHNYRQVLAIYYFAEYPVGSDVHSDWLWHVISGLHNTQHALARPPIN